MNLLHYEVADICPFFLVFLGVLGVNFLESSTSEKAKSFLGVAAVRSS